MSFQKASASSRRFSRKTGYAFETSDVKRMSSTRVVGQALSLTALNPSMEAMVARRSISNYLAQVETERLPAANEIADIASSKAYHNNGRLRFNIIVQSKRFVFHVYEDAGGTFCSEEPRSLGDLFDLINIFAAAAAPITSSRARKWFTTVDVWREPLRPPQMPREMA
jgi:hypothetical protein